MTAPKNKNQTFQPIPVRSAMRSIRFIVLFSRARVESKEWFYAGPSPSVWGTGSGKTDVLRTAR